MNEVETKIANAIAELVRLLVPMTSTHDERHELESALDTMRSALISAVGKRIIKGSK